MRIIRLIENSRKLNNEQFDTVKNIFSKGKYSQFKALERFLTLVAAGVLYRYAIETWDTDKLQSIAIALFGTHLWLKNIVLSTLVSLGFTLSLKGDKSKYKKDLKDITKIMRS
jgi:hypothetical protein|nr:MAG TPA: hypothetical protein [Bacteriophage sp.]